MGIRHFPRWWLGEFKRAQAESRQQAEQERGRYVAALRQHRDAGLRLSPGQRRMVERADRAVQAAGVSSEREAEPEASWQCAST